MKKGFRLFHISVGMFGHTPLTTFTVTANSTADALAAFLNLSIPMEFKNAGLTFLNELP